MDPSWIPHLSGTLQQGHRSHSLVVFSHPSRPLDRPPSLAVPSLQSKGERHVKRYGDPHWLSQDSSVCSVCVKNVSIFSRKRWEEHIMYMQPFQNECKKWGGYPHRHLQNETSKRIMPYCSNILWNLFL